MIRFVQPDGSPIDLDYTGTIHAVDSGNDIIAVCHGREVVFDEDEEHVIVGNPTDWDDWEFVSNVEKEEFLARAIASAYSALALCERIMVAEIK
jgi:hypothetical protein